MHRPTHQQEQRRAGSGRSRKRAGFTLVEIIAVLVILAVLAAVSIPRYLSLTEMARVRALDNALATGLSHVSMAFGRLVLQNQGQAPSAAALAAAATAQAPRSADYAFSFAATASGGVGVTVAEIAEPTRTATREWRSP